jgi:hypothetical protein
MSEKIPPKPHCHCVRLGKNGPSLLVSELRRSVNSDIFRGLDNYALKTDCQHENSVAETLALLRAGRLLGMRPTFYTAAMKHAIWNTHCDIIQALLDHPSARANNKDKEAIKHVLYLRYEPKLASLYPRLFITYPPTTHEHAIGILRDKALHDSVFPYLFSFDFDLREYVGFARGIERLLDLEANGYNISQSKVLHQAALVMASPEVLRLLISRCDGYGSLHEARQLGFFWALCASEDEKRAFRERDPSADLLIHALDNPKHVAQRCYLTDNNCWMKPYPEDAPLPLEIDDIIGVLTSFNLRYCIGRLLTAHAELSADYQKIVADILCLRIPPPKKHFSSYLPRVLYGLQDDH